MNLPIPHREESHILLNGKVYLLVCNLCATKQEDTRQKKMEAYIKVLSSAASRKQGYMRISMCTVKWDPGV